MVKKFTFDTDRTLIFAVNYGGQNEIVRGVKSFLQSSDSGESLQEKINALDESTL